MAQAVPQVSTAQTRRRATRLAMAALAALSASGCLSRSPTTTGSLATPVNEEAWASQSEALGRRFEANPGDAAAAVNYARALRALGQHAQALAVLQQAAIRNPKHFELLGAYGKALADVGRLKEAADVLSRAHVPERPDWRILSAQGAVADQVNDHALAQQYYEAALRIVPNDASVLSNLGLSYALAKRLGDAERVLKQASAQPNADARVRQNLALVLGLQGKFPEAEEVLRRDLPPEAASANLAALRGMVSQPNSWNVIRRAGQDPRTKTAMAPND